LFFPSRAYFQFPMKSSLCFIGFFETCYIFCPACCLPPSIGFPSFVEQFFWFASPFTATPLLFSIFLRYLFGYDFGNILSSKVASSFFPGHRPLLAGFFLLSSFFLYNMFHSLSDFSVSYFLFFPLWSTGRDPVSFSALFSQDGVYQSQSSLGLTPQCLLFFV